MAPHTHESELVLSLQGHFPGETKDGLEFSTYWAC